MIKLVDSLKGKAINTLMLFFVNSESLIISWSVWMKQGAEKNFKNNTQAFILNALLCRKTWMRFILIPLFSRIYFMFSQILKPVWKPSISLQGEGRCLYSKLCLTIALSRNIWCLCLWFCPYVICKRQKLNFW